MSNEQLPPEDLPLYQGLPSEPLMYRPTPSDMMRPLSGDVPTSEGEQFVSPYAYQVPSKPSNLGDYLGQYAPPPPSGPTGTSARRMTPLLVIGAALVAAVLVLAIGLLVVVLRGNSTPPIQLTIVEKTATATAKATQSPAQATPQAHHTPTAPAVTPTTIVGIGGPGPQPQPTTTPVPGATSTPTPMPGATPTPIPAPQTFTDDLNTLGYISSQSGQIIIDSTSTIDGDSARAVRRANDAEWMVWHKPQITNFIATTYFFTGDTPAPFSFLTSANGTTWTTVTPSSTIANGANQWNVYTYSLSGISGANYLKIQWGTGTVNQWTPQIGQVKITYQP